jgi:hypothetical protein
MQRRNISDAPERNPLPAYHLPNHLTLHTPKNKTGPKMPLNDAGAGTSRGWPYVYGAAAMVSGIRIMNRESGNNPDLAAPSLLKKEETN